MSKTILMPPGKISRGSYFAACLLLALNHDTAIARQASISREDLAAADHLTINMRDDRNRRFNNPDQGHYATTNEECPLGQILQQQQLLDVSLRFHPWIRGICIRECSGADGLADYMREQNLARGMTVEALDMTDSPVETTLIDSLAEQGERILTPGDNAHQLMAIFGADILQRIEASRQKEVEALGNMQEIVGTHGLNALFIADDDCGLILEHYQKTHRPDIKLLFWNVTDMQGNRRTHIRRTDAHRDSLSLTCFFPLGANGKPKLPEPHDRRRPVYRDRNIWWCSNHGHLAKTYHPMTNAIHVQAMLASIADVLPFNNAFDSIKVTTEGKPSRPRIKLSLILPPEEPTHEPVAEAVTEPDSELLAV